MKVSPNVLKGTLAAMLSAAAGFAVINEGIVLKTYPDPALGWKVPTACAGDTGPHIQPGMVFSMQECMNMLETRHAKTWERVSKCITHEVTPPQAVSILSLADNVGVGPVCGSTLIAQLNAGLPPAVWCQQYLRWNFVGGRDCRLKPSKCPGIPPRRARERNMCMGLG